MMKKLTSLKTVQCYLADIRRSCTRPTGLDTQMPRYSDRTERCIPRKSDTETHICCIVKEFLQNVPL